MFLEALLVACWTEAGVSTHLTHDSNHRLTDFPIDYLRVTNPIVAHLSSRYRISEFHSHWYRSIYHLLAMDYD